MNFAEYSLKFSVSQAGPKKKYLLYLIGNIAITHTWI